MYKSALWRCITANIRTPEGASGYDYDPAVAQFMAVIGYFIPKDMDAENRIIPERHEQSRPDDQWAFAIPTVVWGRVAIDARYFRYLHDYEDGPAYRPVLYGQGFPEIPSRVLRERGLWDWAGVKGLWVQNSAYNGREVHVDSRRFRRRRIRYKDAWEFPTEWVLDLADGPQAISQQFSARLSSLCSSSSPSSSTKKPILPEILWDHFPAFDSDYIPPYPSFPPIWFHNAGQSNSGDAFVYGVVCLSGDSPPELVWTIAWQSIAVPYLGVLFQGVEIGGCGSGYGVMGVSGLSTELTCS